VARTTIGTSIRNIKLLAHGETGTGKTYLAGTAAQVDELCPILYFDFEQGIMTLASIPEALDESRLVPWEVSNKADLGFVEKVINSPGDVKVEDEPIKTVVLDSMTEMYGLMMRMYLGDQGRLNTPPQIQDYGFVHHRIMQVLRTLQTLPLNIIATAGTEMNKDELSGAIHQEPDITGKMNHRVGRYFDIVGYMSVSIGRQRGGASITRDLQVVPYGRVRAKDRSGKLGVNVTEPTMRKIYDIIMKGQE
jgi:hypothetical protein